MKRRLVFSIALSVFFVASRSLAVGVIVSPSELTVSGKAGGEATVRLEVQNPGAGPAQFVAAPGSLAGMIRAFPSSFVLESGERRDLVVRVLPERAGTFQTTLNVSARPLSGNFPVGSGVKIPLTITAAPSGKPLAAILFSGANLPWALLAATLIVFGLLEVRRRGQRM